MAGFIGAPCEMSGTEHRNQNGRIGCDLRVAGHHGETEDLGFVFITPAVLMMS